MRTILVSVTIGLSVPAVIFACDDSDEPAASGSQDAAAGDGGANPSEVSSSPDSPRILSLTVSPPALKPDASVVIGAIVSDPQGIADVAGGTFAQVGGNDLGVFAGTVGSGAFTYALSWDLAHAIDPLNFPGDARQRDYRATFYDAKGNTTEKIVAIRFDCDPPGAPIRNGTCDEACAQMAECQDWAARKGGVTATCRDGFCMAGIAGSTPEACSAACDRRNLDCVAASSTLLPDAGMIYGYVQYGDAGACPAAIGSCDEVPAATRDCGGTQSYATQACYCR